MILNSNTYTQYSPYDCIEVLVHGCEEATEHRIKLAFDVVTGQRSDSWNERFYLLKGHPGRWADHVFKSLHLARPDLDNEAFHTIFSHAVAEACLKVSQSRHLITVSALKTWKSLGDLYLKSPETPDKILQRVLDRLANHPKFHAPSLDHLFVPAASEHSTLRAEQYNLDTPTLLHHLVGDQSLFDGVFEKLRSRRLTWALENIPEDAVNAYFERHPQSDKLSTRLEIDLGL